MAMLDARLEDRFDAAGTRLFLTGNQALARALLTRSWIDARAGQNTAGFVSGYRGSPLGALDSEFEAAAEAFGRAHIKFQPGVNEELAATAIWGSQQVGLFPGARFDGVFGLWYGKGPGVDRSGDAFKHANLAGTAPLGGVLAVAGDDHRGASSTTAHQSEFAFIDAQIPILVPANVQDILDFAITGIALSRACGCWVALKCAAEVVEQAATVDAGLARFDVSMPAPAPDLHIRWPDRVTDQETRLAGPKRDAAHAFAAANGLDRVLWKGRESRIGVAATGKAWGDVMEALEILRIDEDRAGALGLCLMKVGLAWPLNPVGAGVFADGLEEILCIEEKRPLLEPQLRDLLYDRDDAPRLRITGKHGPDGAALVPLAGEIDPHMVARTLARRLGIEGDARTASLGTADTGAERAAAAGAPKPVLRRPPHFCSGCPHNTSTRVPDGHRALAGIGCHTLALWSDPNTETLTQMGGEGATWIGQAPFTDTPHVFANIGDGTYYHSGLLAIRAALTSGVTMTYKLLFNDAVAMTGGQKVEGNLTVPAIARALAAEGVGRIIVVAEEPGHYQRNDPFPAGVTVMGRDGFDCAQAELATTEGVSVLIFDQTCAAEKRRRRRRGKMEDPARWVFINERLCEGCGDCQQASHCLSVVPVETPFGTKRRIDMASCNKDESCLNGFCPAMVVVEGTAPRRPASADAEVPAHLRTLPEPAPVPLDRPRRILIAGIGGTGVVTAGHLIAMAAHLDGNRPVVMDQTGLAQKGGSVASHITIAGPKGHSGAGRTPAGRCDLVIGCDLVVTADSPQLATIAPGNSRIIVNTAETITGAFLRDPDRAFPASPLMGAITAQAGADAVTTADATRLAARLVGAAISANVFLLGIAWQMGLVPVSEAALMRAIELNGAGAAANHAAFTWGRRFAVDATAVSAVAGLATGAHQEGSESQPESLEDVIRRHEEFLTAYEGAALATQYRALVERARGIDDAHASGKGLARAVTESYFRLLSPKDEYEVARLYTDTEFDATLSEAFADKGRVSYFMAPAWLARRDRVSGLSRKMRFGPWLKGPLRLLAAMRGVRGTMLDPFRFTAERKLERRHLAEYERDIERILHDITPENFASCVELASLPLEVRGFGHVKAAAKARVDTRRAALLAALETPAQASAAE